jgi:hypothetical protein
MQNLQVSRFTRVKKADRNHTCCGGDLASLGIITKYCAIRINTSFERPHDFILQDQSKKLLPKERVKNCLINRVDKSKNRKIVYVSVTDKTYWDNVQRCGSLWICPCCSKNITECRRKELTKASDLWLSETPHNSLLLLTLTNAHTINDDLKLLLKQQSKALHSFWTDRRGLKLWDEMAKFGHIRGLEPTFGKNGFHPHYHVLLFLRKNLTQDEIIEFKYKLFEHWFNCCKKAKLGLPSLEHGLDLRNGDKAKKYISKWGLEHELTKAHSKKGKEGSYTPFDLLNLSINDELLYGRKPSYLFKKYSEAFKNKRQLSWSNGLKDYFKINEKDDEQIINDVVNNSIELIDVSNQVFYLLRNVKMRHLALDWAKNDYKNGTLDCGEYVTNIFELLQEKNFISPYLLN